MSRRVPAWVTDGWYGNNPDKQQMAISRYHMPVTNEAERVAAQEFTAEGETFGCSNCGKFAFHRPTLCFWCTTTRSSLQPSGT